MSAVLLLFSGAWVFSLRICVICIVFVAVSAQWVHAREVTFPYKGLTLNANLELAVNSKIADGVILITHGGLGHHGMEIISYMQKLLKDRGYNTLAINLSLGLDNRHGMHDCAVTQRHTNDDAVAEIGAWVNWLKQQSTTRIVLLGHSRGGAQTALFASQTSNPLVKAIVLLAPATRDNTDTSTYLRNFNQPLAPVLEKAQKLHNSGKGDTVLKQISLLNCSDTSATADTVLSYYAQAPQNLRLDTPALLPKIKQPVLVVVAGSDETVVGLDKKIALLADGKRVQLKNIKGADHTFRDLYAEETIDAIDLFLQGAAYAPRKP